MYGEFPLNYVVDFNLYDIIKKKRIILTKRLLEKLRLEKRNWLRRDGVGVWIVT